MSRVTPLFRSVRKFICSSLESGRKTAVIYTDGACLNNGRENSRAGIGVHWPDNESNNISMPISGRATNQRAEIQAVVHALNQAREQGYTRVELVVDSAYVKNAIDSWITEWELNGYKTCNNTDVVNKVDFQQLRDSMKGLELLVKHVPRELNLAADKLARLGAKQN